jgi:hypothetical protein
VVIYLSIFLITKQLKHANKGGAGPFHLGDFKVRIMLPYAKYRFDFNLGKNPKTDIVAGTCLEDCRFKLQMKYSRASKPVMIEKETLLESFQYQDFDAQKLQEMADYSREMDTIHAAGVQWDKEYGAALVEFIRLKKRFTNCKRSNGIN